ncbi:hypothetical protein [Microcella sp.]|uniref:hypothetical protein n=1 Tax=Microcella sp. TaxID=1913979 RepID=UPI003F71997B
MSVKTTPLPNTYLGTASTNESACGTPQPTLEVGLYLYKKLNPDAPAAWSNSGLQRFIASQSGSSWFTEFPTVLPEDVCGEGWAVQQDKVSHTGGFTWPSTIEYPDDNIGWPPIYAAKHDNLELYLDVPDCEPPTLPALGVVAEASEITCETDGWFGFGPGLGVTEDEAALMEWTVGPAEYAGATETDVKHPVSGPVTITVTVSLIDSAQGDYSLSDESGGGTADPKTGDITYTFVFDAPVDCPVVVPEITWVDECVMEDIELELAASALIPVASFTVTASPNVSYTYTIDGGSPMDVVFPLGEDTVTIPVTPGATVVVTAAAASGFVLPEGYEPWEKTFEVSERCIDLPVLANWPASASATAQVCSPLGSLVSGSITVVFPEGSIENPDPVRYFIAYGTPQQQELTSAVTAVAPGSYVVTAIPTVPTDSINDSGDRADFPLTVGAAADPDCGQLDTLAFTGAGAVTNWLGVAAVLLMVAGMGFVIRRNRVEV